MKPIHITEREWAKEEYDGFIPVHFETTIHASDNGAANHLLSLQITAEDVGIQEKQTRCAFSGSPKARHEFLYNPVLP